MGVDNKFEIKILSWNKWNEPYIQEVFRLLKDQENKIFDLSYGSKDTILDYVQRIIVEGNVFVILEDGKVVASMMLDDLKFYKDRYLSCNLHCVIRKHSWGKKSREICRWFLDYLRDEFVPIKRLVASVPQHNFGIVKLLKDMGFKHEGTLRSNLIFPDKYGNEKYYDELVYSIVREDI